MQYNPSRLIFKEMFLFLCKGLSGQVLNKRCSRDRISANIAGREAQMGIGFTELIVILVIILILFGPGKLPEIGKALGKGIREFKDAQKEVKKQIKSDEEDPN